MTCCGFAGWPFHAGGWYSIHELAIVEEKEVGSMSGDMRLTQYPCSSKEKEIQLEEALRKDPSNIQIKKTLAFTYYTNQKFQRAIELYFQLSISQAGDPAVHFYMGNTLFRLNSHQSAIASWERCIENDESGIYTERARQRIAMAKMAATTT